MSTQTQKAPAATVPAEQNEIKIVSHSTLFYWWPVWAVGFLMAGLTYLDGDRLATVPAGTKAVLSGGFQRSKRRRVGSV